MEKFGQYVQKNLFETYYRVLSITHLTVNKVAIPTAQKVSTIIQNSMKTSETNSANEGYGDIIKRNLRDGFIAGNDLAFRPLNSLGEYIDQSTIDLERKLREEHRVNTNQWMFSRENLEMIEKINLLVDLTFKEVEHISKLDGMRYLTAWTALQKFYYTTHEKQISVDKALDFQKDDKRLFQLKQIQEECLYFSTFAHGTYGKVLNSIYREKSNFSKLMRITDYTQDFVEHTKIEDKDVLHSFWDTTPYNPAHVIARDQLKKTIILCMRGTHHWADVITDLDFHYLSFSVVRDSHNGKLFIRFNYKDESQEYLRKRLGDDTRELNGGINQPLRGNEEVLVTGYTHAGMFISAIGAYKEITPKLEDIFSKYEYNDYDLAVTGHSLGGGMATLMVLLFMIHPLKALKGDLNSRLSGYSYGGASVLSPEFTRFFEPIMKNIVLGYDIVPRLSYGSIKDICNIMTAFDEMNTKEPEKLNEMLSLDTNINRMQMEPSSYNKSFMKLYENLKQKYMNSPKLFPMGRSFQIHDFKTQAIRRRTSYYDFVFTEVDALNCYEEIIFSKQFIKHHFPYFYEEGLWSNRVLYQNFLPVGDEKMIPIIESSNKQEI